MLGGLAAKDNNEKRTFTLKYIKVEEEDKIEVLIQEMIETGQIIGQVVEIEDS